VGSDVTELVVVRHGESTWNVESRFTGQADPPLSERGQEQAADLARRCVVLSIDAVVTSDLDRAFTTGLAVTRRLGLPRPVRLPSLRERWNRTLEGMGSQDIEARFPGVLAAWREARPVSLAGEFENYDAFAARVTEALVESAGHGDRVLVVAHAGVFVVLDQLSGAADASGIGNAEGRRVMVGPDGRLVVGDLVRVDGPSGFLNAG
jgi:broad specificity phosphatase PhoE